MPIAPNITYSGPVATQKSFAERHTGTRGRYRTEALWIRRTDNRDHEPGSRAADQPYLESTIMTLIYTSSLNHITSSSSPFFSVCIV